VKNASFIRPTELMAVENPPRIFHTPGNIDIIEVEVEQQKQQQQGEGEGPMSMEKITESPLGNGNGAPPREETLVANSGLQKQQEMGDKAIKIEPQEEEAEKEDEEKDDAEEEGEQDAEKQPPGKIARSRGGQKREYNFLKSVNSVEELDTFRFKVI
jgi:hypothetical protein